MVFFPNCKINLGLNIIRKRDDGFHDLETIFYPVGLKDCLEIITSNNTENAVEYSSSGLAIDGKEDDNLCIKAYHLLKKDLPQLPSVKIHLHKAIPMGAGLGGGSADGAFALKLLNEKFRLNLSAEQLIHYAAQLGSDGPFFIINKPCFASGRGEILEEINVDLSPYKIVLINPGIHINTAWAFTQLQPAVPQYSIKEIIQQPVASWRDMLHNDFENAVFTAHPEIKKIKDSLYHLGAVYAAMSGSGSTVFGLFEKRRIVKLNFPEKYFIKVV